MDSYKPVFNYSVNNVSCCERAATTEDFENSTLFGNFVWICTIYLLHYICFAMNDQVHLNEE